jgi:transposase InsO family protein
VALEAIREQHTIKELAGEYGVHPNLIQEWKKHLLSELPQVFNSRKGDEQKTLEEERDRLFQQIGQLQYKLAWLKKSWRGTLPQKRQAIDIDEPRLSVRRLLRTMGLRAIYPSPKTSQPAPSHQIYPYLLRGVAITRPNVVWPTDITYIRPAHGFVYLVAIMDWYSRYMLAWRLSNSLETHFCVEALEML